MKNSASLLPIVACVLALIPVAQAAQAGNDGYLLLTFVKASYSSGSTTPGMKNDTQSQSYKIQLSSDFYALFKNKPTPDSAGTELYCNVGEKTAADYSGIQFTQWFAPRDGGRVSTWFWASGFETVAGRQVSAENAKSQTTIGFPSWTTVDSSQMVSFNNDTAEEIHGVNVSLSVKSVASDDPALKTALSMPVRGADGSVVSAGDAQTTGAFSAGCAFQNN